MKFCFFLSFVFLTFFSQNSYPLDQLIRVHVLSSYSLSEVQILGSLAKLKLPEGGSETFWPPQLPLWVQAKGNQLLIRIGQSSQTVPDIIVEPPRGSFLIVQSSEGLEKRFIGKLLIHSEKGKLFFIEELWLEEYVQGVLGEMIPFNFPLEASKAEAVLLRTKVIGALGRHRKEQFDFCDQAHCQVYEGLSLVYRSLKKAVEQTKSLFLVQQWKPVKISINFNCKKEPSFFLGILLGEGDHFCPFGAERMAESGKKFDEILVHYFPGTSLVER